MQCIHFLIIMILYIFIIFIIYDIIYIYLYIYLYIFKYNATVFNIILCHTYNIICYISIYYVLNKCIKFYKYVLYI